MMKSIRIKISQSVLDNIDPKEIIYAEVAGGGAMGNAGGIIIYCIKDDQFICYETSLFNDKENYLRAEELLLKHQSVFKNANLTKGEELFDYYEGSMGNLVFINKNVNLEISDEFFIYRQNDKEYQILSSVQGVFYHVVNTMENFQKNNLFKKRDF